MADETVDSSGNVFADLGFEPAEAAVLQMRATLLTDLRARIQSRGWSTAEAAEMLNVPARRVEDLLSGKWDRFSLEALITLATRAGCRVDMHLAA